MTSFSELRSQEFFFNDSMVEHEFLLLSFILPNKYDRFQAIDTRKLLSVAFMK